MLVSQTMESLKAYLVVSGLEVEIRLKVSLQRQIVGLHFERNADEKDWQMLLLCCRSKLSIKKSQAAFSKL